MALTSPSNLIADLYSAHHGWLHGWLRRKTGCTHYAADLAQDTFIKLMRVELAQIDEPRAYLATVANRLLLDSYRRQALERSYQEALLAMPEQDVPSLEAQALIREALLEIDRMLDGLGDKVKQAFILSQFEELPYAEIARKLDISLRSVNNYIARAMAQCCLLLP